MLRGSHERAARTQAAQAQPRTLVPGSTSTRSARRGGPGPHELILQPVVTAAGRGGEDEQQRHTMLLAFNARSR
jgi:hypothetical protein